MVWLIGERGVARLSPCSTGLFEIVHLEVLFAVNFVTGIYAGISNDIPYYRHRFIQTPSSLPLGSILLEFDITTLF